MKKSPYKIVHTSDALRLFLIRKFGGFYLDLDYVVLNDLSHYNNILVGNSKCGPFFDDCFLFMTIFMFRVNPVSVTNSAFSFAASHPVLVRALSRLQEAYEPDSWGGIGPDFLTSVAEYSQR